MIRNIDNLKLLDILNGTSVRYRTFENRFSHALVFKTAGTCVYRFGNKTLMLRQGEMMFIPKGSYYDVENVSDNGTYVLINFDADVADAAPDVYSIEKYPELSFIYTHLAKLWLFGDEAEKYKCYSIFYDVLAFISAKENPQYSYQQKAKKIENAVKHLHTHMFSCDLKVDELHLLCSMSDTYFRKIFVANFGTTPQQYITNKRLSHARSILCSGDYNSIAEVARAVGYSDALYFSRIFSKKYGACPSEYAQKY